MKRYDCPMLCRDPFSPSERYPQGRRVSPREVDLPSVAVRGAEPLARLYRKLPQNSFLSL